jgi:DNA replication protein DnaC
VLGREAAVAGYRVRYTLTTKLVKAVGVEDADHDHARCGRVDLLAIDELGCIEVDRRGSELLFQVLTEREEKSCVAIASNDSSEGWTKPGGPRPHG